MLQRLIDLTMHFWEHGPDADKLRRFGWTDLVEFGGQLTGTGPSGIRTALYRGGDPIAPAVCIAMGQCGMLWPTVLPGLLKAIAKAWKAARIATPAGPRDTPEPAPPEPSREPAVVLSGQLDLFAEEP